MPLNAILNYLLKPPLLRRTIVLKPSLGIVGGAGGSGPNPVENPELQGPAIVITSLFNPLGCYIPNKIHNSV
jgi:hypothetical protein